MFTLFNKSSASANYLSKIAGLKKKFENVVQAICSFSIMIL